VYKAAVGDTSDLKQHLIDTWASVSQNIIDEPVDQWRKRLRACEKAKCYPSWPRKQGKMFSGYEGFAHKLSDAVIAVNGG